MNNLKIGLVIADFDEYKPLEEFINRGEYSNYSFLGRKGHKFTIQTNKGEAEVISLLCGIGKVNATAAAMHLVDIGCSIILNYGLSGGISGVNKGDICLCTKYAEHDFDISGIGYKPFEKPSQEYIYNCDEYLLKLAKNFLPNAKCGTAVSGDCFICDEDKRIYLKENLSAMSCDMETAAIAYVCSFSKIPFLAIRRISDDADDSAVESYREMNSSNETVLSDLVIDYIQVLIDKFSDK